MARWIPGSGRVSRAAWSYGETLDIAISTEVEGPLEALRLLEGGQEVHVLFTDVVMPDMSGRQLADRAREMNPNLKILYTTGYTRNAIAHNGFLDAGTNLLTKPFTIEELASKVRTILDI